MPTALVRRPGPRLDEGLVTHIERESIDLALAVAQWQRYVDVLVDHGWEIVEVEPADDCPDAVFVEDAIVVFDDTAVITLPGAVERRAETAGAERAAVAAGLSIAHIAAPGVIDGGDVLKIGRTVLVGLGGRTNREAIDQLAAVLTPRGWDVRAIPVTKVLHLKSAVTALPDGTVIGFPDDVDDATYFERFLAVPERAGAHVVLIGSGPDDRERILMASGAPESASMFRALGYEPVEVEISEFEKLEGCVTCLSVRIRR